MTEVRTLGPADARLVRDIDRSEHVDVEYAVVDGRLVERPATMVDVPPWDATGGGERSVTAHVRHVEDDLRRGGILLGCFTDAGDTMGLATVVPAFEPPVAQLAWLHVSRPHRRRGVASALWRRAVELARAEGARAMYVSATPTGSAVGFYLRQGCRLAAPPHPQLLALEPDDIHLVCSLG